MRSRGGSAAAVLAVAAMATAVLTVAAMASACTSGQHDVARPTDTTPSSSGSKVGTTSTQAPFEHKEITVLITGDIVIHTSVWLTAEADAAREGRGRPDFRPMFASIRPDVRAADLAVCRFQLPVTDPGGPYLNYPVFASPPEIINALKATGYDACTTAGNHNLDQGWTGIERTVATYNRVGLPQTGMSTSRKQNRRPLILDVKGVKVALLSYSYGTNGIPVPSDEPWCVRLINPKRMIADAHKAKQLGADIVLMDVHAGTEYDHTPNQEQLDVVDQVSRSPDINLLYGAHPHVTQPFAVVHHKWVAYSLGNLVAQQHIDGTYYSAMARFTFVNHPGGSWTVRRARFIPTLTTDDASAMRILNAPRALHDPALSAWRLQLQAAITNTTAVVDGLNARRHGLRMGR